jgi:uncharacterized damage-inducible protein DinB
MHRGDQVRSADTLVDDLVRVLRQGQELILALSAEAYREEPPELGVASVGAHYRHHLQHVELFVEGLPKGLVDYDARARVCALGTNRELASAATDAVIAGLLELKGAREDQTVNVVHATSAAPVPPSTAPSTLGRELMFLLSHAVHHYAVMSMLARLSGHAPPDELGVMPSTLLWRKQSLLS